jgi:hypothetical protein
LIGGDIKVTSFLAVAPAADSASESDLVDPVRLGGIVAFNPWAMSQYV